MKRGVRRFVREQDRDVREMNKATGTGCEGYADYLESNPGDDADVTMEELKKLAKEE